MGESFEHLISDVLDSSIYNLFPKLKDTKSTKRSVAIFWDYDNFPILKNEDLEVFFDQIIPQESSNQILVKRVFCTGEHINKRRESLEKRNFEIINVPNTGKKNITDMEIFAHCIEFCLERKEEPTSILLITGDRDYISLIRKITELGHDVSQICRDKKTLHQELIKRVPNTLDRNDLFSQENFLKYKLKFESNPSEWKEKWEKLKIFYPSDKERYKHLRNIYHQNENIEIRNLILLELEELAKEK